MWKDRECKADYVKKKKKNRTKAYLARTKHGLKRSLNHEKVNHPSKKKKNKRKKIKGIIRKKNPPPMSSKTFTTDPQQSMLNDLIFRLITH